MKNLIHVRTSLFLNQFNYQMSNNDLVSEFVQSGIANQISYIVSAFIATVLCAWTRRSALVNGDQVLLTSLLACRFLLVLLYYV